MFQQNIRAGRRCMLVGMLRHHGACREKEMTTSAGVNLVGKN